MHTIRRLQHLRNINVCRFSRANRNTTQSRNLESAEQIDVPNRIHRSPTDILNALARTVGRDPTAAHYKYHDDPYLIPTSNLSKRTYAMSQESGRKAAKWIREQHRELFMHEEAQPKIEAFAPKMIFNEESEVDETSLKQLIMQSEVKDAVFVYNLLKQKGIEINKELMQSMLELVCFYNNEEPLPEDLIEERSFVQNVSSREKHRKTWKDSDLAEQIFSEMKPQTSEAYAAIIRGMAKYLQAERAYALIQKAVENQMQLDANTFNVVISIINYLKETADQRWELCLDLLQQMESLQIKPNLGTLNALLSTISTFNNFKLARSSALSVMGEFKKLGVEPSLGTYYYLLIIFCRERGSVSHIIVDILAEIKDKEFTIKHPRDIYFFATAMDVCRNHLHDKMLAKKVNTFLHTGDNYNLIGDSYMEAIYYRNYIALLCQTEPIEEFMKIYDLLVPNIYTPEPGIMEEILKAVENHGAAELMPRLWSDMVIFDHINRESLLTRSLRIMMNHKLDTSEHIQKDLPEQFANVALSIYNKIEEPSGRGKKLSFTGQMIGDILTLLVRGGNYEKAAEVFANIDKNQHRIPGTPSEECLLEFIDACILRKAPSQAINCLQYAIENNMDGLSMATKINKGFTLNEVHLSKIKSMVGDHF